jgi:alanine-synthesizing transaminase
MLDEGGVLRVNGAGRSCWSVRTQWDTTESPWARELSRLRAEGRQLWDLTASNPTTCGFAYDAAAILGPLHDPRVLLYEPNPRGLVRAREAVSRYYRDHGASVETEQIFLTVSTSEAYSYLFRLLCDAGDEVLIGQPGYPLFDFLAQLDNVRLVPYELFYDHGWHIDLEALGRRITSRTRAIVVVHPNNPTGHFTRTKERALLEELCREHGFSLIVDEVFLDYGHAGNEAGKSFATGGHPVSTFVVSGLSKVAALPQMKAAWIACFAGQEAQARLEVIADTFLSMNAPVQHALAAWLGQRSGMQEQIRERVGRNLASLDALLLRQSLVTRLELDAGWYAVLRVPGVQSEEEIALHLLLERGVVVHPGSFFGFSSQGWLVVSLLASEGEFLTGAEKLITWFASQTL